MLLLSRKTSHFCFWKCISGYKLDTEVLAYDLGPELVWHPSVASFTRSGRVIFTTIYFTLIPLSYRHLRRREIGEKGRKSGGCWPNGQPGNLARHPSSPALVQFCNKEVGRRKQQISLYLLRLCITESANNKCALNLLYLHGTLQFTKSNIYISICTHIYTHIHVHIHPHINIYIIHITYIFPAPLI